MSSLQNFVRIVEFALSKDEDNIEDVYSSDMHKHICSTFIINVFSNQSAAPDRLKGLLEMAETEKGRYNLSMSIILPMVSMANSMDLLKVDDFEHFHNEHVSVDFGPGEEKFH